MESTPLNLKQYMRHLHEFISGSISTYIFLTDGLEEDIMYQ